MKKLAVLMAMVAAVGLIGGCTKQSEQADTSASAQSSQTSAEASETAAETTKAAETTAAGAEQKDADQVLTVGFDQNFPPMGFVGDDGEFTGFDLELAKEAAKRLGMEVKYQPIAWDAKDMELNSGNIDCVWNGFTINGREDAYTWSAPYMANTQVYVVAKDSGITDAAGLAGKKIEVQADSSAEAALKDQPDVIASFGEFVTTPDYNTAFLDLEMGAVDAIAIDIVVAGYQIEKRGDDKFMILSGAISSEDYGIGFKKGNEALRDKLDAVLLEMAKDGTLKTISEKWFGQDVTTVGK